MIFWDKYETLQICNLLIIFYSFFVSTLPSTRTKLVSGNFTETRGELLCMSKSVTLGQRYTEPIRLLPTG